jgi:hypothetical protein
MHNTTKPAPRTSPAVLGMHTVRSTARLAKADGVAAFASSSAELKVGASDRSVQKLCGHAGGGGASTRGLLSGLTVSGICSD